ncbi:Crp/Fnr family transcriptional regulator [Aquincola sp. S2]|uniref:Crp/Fnr family transcriptional regulator n=1 Tax=Pseudaquabacterium terrae TaxID=2732868 RepID=A0ABX2ERJ2_9BURK|nr:Crp/Fnr family transcriptional regulator [Aquabacterium terrae]
MEDPILTSDERDAINAGRWFASLSASLRHDILRLSNVKRYEFGDQIAARGDPSKYWIGCAKGAVRVSSTSISGKQITLTYVEPGDWFGDVEMVDGGTHTHDSIAHGETTVLRVARADFQMLLSLHIELYEAILRLHARRIRQLYGIVTDLNTLTLRARLAKQLIHLARRPSKRDVSHTVEMRVSLQLWQHELAQLLGASRQRVNAELKAMEREDVIRVERSRGLVVRDHDALKRIVKEEIRAGIQ